MRANILKRKLALRVKRKKRVRADISGTSERPRVSFFKSNRFIYAQAIDDVNGVTLASVDGKKLGFNSSKAAATEVAKVFETSKGGYFFDSYDLENCFNTWH